MILIVSEEKELSTCQVVEWLIYWKLPFQRINKEWDIVDRIEIKLDAIDVWFQQGFSLSDISVTWFRRGYLYVDIPHLNAHETIVKETVQNHLTEERETLRDFVYEVLKEKDGINHPNYYNASKLITLKKALQYGLLVPNTFITTQREALKHFYSREDKKVITKNIQDVISWVTQNQRVGTRTHLVAAKNLETSPTTFFYSAFQAAIQKKYELRVFYFKGRFYAAAIFSQLSQHSAEDARIKDPAKPVRIVPYQLPQHLATKLKALMEDLSLESGSIDLIVTDKGEYYFLEVNPVGQYDYVSKLCNYQLDYHIAQHLKQVYLSKTTI